MNTQQLTELRDALSTVTQALVDVLDAIDGEPDLETADQPDDECNGDPEPSIGNLGRYLNGQLEYDLEFDDSDREFSLGWSNGIGQTSLHASYDDLEEPYEHEDCPGERGDICWMETHGFGNIQDWAYRYGKWNECMPLTQLDRPRCLHQGRG